MLLQIHWRKLFLLKTTASRALMELMRIKAFVRLPLYPLSLQCDGWLKVLVRSPVNSAVAENTFCVEV